MKTPIKHSKRCNIPAVAVREREHCRVHSAECRPWRPARRSDVRQAVQRCSVAAAVSLRLSS
ncbi:hypothetical protein E2C01_043962 [Portunus trituberculatus]|uniref:Uncharacterized protein n=1 Tax=Portunus trituberculatus TaxID=210409 RepID=A0A5B7FQT3_PORTR|nr:hypothetical protein [Portunus trituberculatus]